MAIVCDTFHIIKWYNYQVVDSLRSQEGKRLRKLVDKLASDDKWVETAMVEEERRLVFGTRFLFLANSRTIDAKDKLNRGNAAEAEENAVKAWEDLSNILSVSDCEHGRGNSLTGCLSHKMRKARACEGLHKGP